jgi:hypothetical protein
VIACGASSYFRQSRFLFALTALGAFLARGTMYPRFYFFLIGFAVMVLIRGIVVIPRWVAGRLSGAAWLSPTLTAVFATILLCASAWSLVAN